MKRSKPFTAEEKLILNRWGIMPVDRTGLMSHCLYNSDPDHPVPDVGDPITLEECINQRCEELKHLDNVILTWSGGIDSTLAFYALKAHGIPFKCTVDGNSQREYPKLYQEIVKGQHEGVTAIDLHEALVGDHKPVSNYVTGELGDQMCGTDKLLSMPHLPHRTRLATEQYKPCAFGEYYAAIEHVLGRDDLTVAEFAWALNFFFKFTDVRKRCTKYFNLEDSQTHHFFNSVSFQRWALQNYSKNVHFEKLTDYKEPYKKYIVDQNGDQNYYEKKIKVGSLGNVYRVTGW